MSQAIVTPAAFFCSISGLVGAVLCLTKNSAWRKARVHGTALLIFKAQHPQLHALITTKRKERWRQCCCFIAFQAGLNPHETVFFHPFLFFVPQRVLNRILYPNIMEERKYFSTLIHTCLQFVFEYECWHIRKHSITTQLENDS